MSEVTVGSLGSILPELILLFGGLLILFMDTTLGNKNDSGRGYMAVTVLFLLVGLVGVIVQLGQFTSTTVGSEPFLAMNVIQVDAFGLFVKVTIYAGMLLVALAGGAFMNPRVAGKGEFWSLFLFVTLAMSFAVSATNLLLLFLSIEFLSITSYILVGIVRQDKLSVEAGVKYFLYGSVASSVMLYGMSLLYGASGSLDLATIGEAFANSPDLQPVALVTSLLLLVGLGFKASLAPFYQWAPDTYQGAPTPVTAYLSTASKAVGFAVMARVFIVAFGAHRADWVPILAGLSIFTMVVGNLTALRQTNVKRMLAYSSVAQAGYILMGLVAVVSSTQGDVTLLSINGLNGVLIYLFAYLFTNVGAFMVVMAVEDDAGNADISAFEGLAQRAPVLSWSMFIFLLSLTGIPLTGGFIGKFFVFGAAIQHQYFWLTGVAVITAGIGAFYYLNVARAMFFSSETTNTPKAFSMSLGVQFALLVCVLATFWIGIYPPNVINWVNNASQQLLALAF
ncbi:MAG: NADH-quinone oxidoreductase subunit N [Caldilineaceae bacterium]|nr:NADH-quinone oxidoreductase subunit N [Caldilineaceae bacterium]